MLWIIILCLSFFFLSIQFQLVYSDNSNVILEEYHSSITDMYVLPPFPSSGAEVKIYSKVIDEYGTIQNATLYYTTHPEEPLQNVTMKLINGFPSNGTYLGIIPPSVNVENATVFYRVEFIDDLGYSSTLKLEKPTIYYSLAYNIDIFNDNKIGTYYNVHEHKIIGQIDSYNNMEKVRNPIPISVFIKDKDFPKNYEDFPKKYVTLYYSNYSRPDNSSTPNQVFLHKSSFNLINNTLYYSRPDSFTPSAKNYLNESGFNLYNHTKFTSLNMYLTDDNVDLGIFGNGYYSYNTTLPPFYGNTSMAYFIESIGSNDMKDKTDLKIINYYHYWNETFDAPDYCSKDANIANINFNVLGIDTKNQISNISVGFNAPLLNTSLFYPESHWLPQSFKIKHPYHKYAGYLEIIQLKENEFPKIDQIGLVKDIYHINDECSDANFHISYFDVKNVNYDNGPIEKVQLSSSLFQKEETLDIAYSTDPVINTISISGDPSLFPFDSYTANLILDIPYKGVGFNLINQEDNLNTEGFYTKIKNFTSQIFSNQTYNDCLDYPYKSSILCDNKLKDGSSFYNLHINFFRSYSIWNVIIPIIAIFFLLGAIFIFENSSDNVSNRLTLTLGIFALIFTLPEIINSMKPQILNPTIADSMLSLIIIATIAFTISSIISSSSTIQKWFPKHHTWIDVIVFVIVSGFVIAYFNKYLIDSQLWWLVPVIVFGLGYGLLLRTLGIKVNKPLIHFSRVTKKKDV